MSSRMAARTRNGVVVGLMVALSMGQAPKPEAAKDAKTTPRPTPDLSGIKIAEAAAAIKPLPLEPIPDDPPPHEGALFKLPYRIEAPDLIVIEVLEALPVRPITGEHLVRPDGTISLGYYGEVQVAGLTTTQAKTKIIHHLRTHLSEISLGVVRYLEAAPNRMIAPLPPPGTIDDSLPLPDNLELPLSPRAEELPEINETRDPMKQGLPSLPPYPLPPNADTPKNRAVPSDMPPPPTTNPNPPTQRGGGELAYDKLVDLLVTLKAKDAPADATNSIEARPKSPEPQPEAVSPNASDLNGPAPVLPRLRSGDETPHDELAEMRNAARARRAARAGGAVHPFEERPKVTDPADPNLPQKLAEQLEEKPGVEPEMKPGGQAPADAWQGRYVYCAPEDSQHVFVDIASYNSAVYYVLGDFAKDGRLPYTGNETVLDAMQYAGGFLSTADPKKLVLHRPARAGKPRREYKIDIDAINRGEKKANLQLFPGDRLVAGRKAEYIKTDNKPKK